MKFSYPFLFILFSISVSPLYASGLNRNILFMIEDDGSMDYSIYGNTIIDSPNIEKLANQGTIFDNYHTSVSSCSPSRSVIMSGLPTHQNGMYGLQHSQEHFSSFDEVIGISTYLNDNNYITGIIGKYHVWPNYVYNFTWGNNPNGPGGCQAGASSSCPNTDYNLVSRNITYMNEQIKNFLQYAQEQNKPWFLYIGFGDSHRCGGALGEFCELYGYDSKTNKSSIPDWKPIQYEANDITDVPFFIQNTTIAKKDIANMYTVKNRIDQGIGLFLNTLETQFPIYNDNTLIMFTSDNGIPFAAGKTNMYEVATIEPMIMVLPNATKTGIRTPVLASSIDLVPTWLDWLQLPLPNYTVLGTKIVYTGKSLLPYIGTDHHNQQQSYSSTISSISYPKHRVVQSQEEIQQYMVNLPLSTTSTPLPLPKNYSKIFASFQLHEIQEYFPMRTVIAIGDNGAHYRLIYNIAHWLPYPIASDLWSAPATQDLVNQYALNSSTTIWYRNISWYFYIPDARTAFELYDIVNDPMELQNVANNPAYSTIFTTLQQDIKTWQTVTNDDWIIKYTHE